MAAYSTETIFTLPDQSPARVVYDPGFTTDIRFTTSSAEGMGVADLNANGILEIVIGEQSGSQSYIYWNMNPSSVTQLGFGGACYGVAIGDMNQDGSSDVILAGYGPQSRIYWGPLATRLPRPLIARTRGNRSLLMSTWTGIRT